MLIGVLFDNIHLNFGQGEGGVFLIKRIIDFQGGFIDNHSIFSLILVLSSIKPFIRNPYLASVTETFSSE